MPWRAGARQGLPLQERPEIAVARVAEARHDVGPLIQSVVDGRRMDEDIGMRRGKLCDAFRAANQANETYAAGAVCLKQSYGLRGAPAGREHRVENEHIRRSEMGRKIGIVLLRSVRHFVAEK